MEQLCTVRGCQQPARRRTYCTKHYERWRRYGSPKGGGREEVSSEELQAFVAQAIRHKGAACLLWPYPTPKHGYGRITQDGRRRLAHVVVCEAVHGPQPFPKAQAAHACGQPGCLNPKHLRWASHQSNMADRLIHGTDNRGERHGQSKLTKETVLAIRASADSYSMIAKRYGITSGHVSDIKNGYRWGWLPPIAR